MTLSLVAVFIPIIFIGGSSGRLFHKFAITICVAILVSGFVSPTLTPILCSRLLKATNHHRSPNLLYRITERGFNWLLAGYKWMLTSVLKYRSITLIVSVLLLVLAMYLYTVVPKGFIPTEDTGQLFANTKAAQDISFEDMSLDRNSATDNDYQLGG